MLPALREVHLVHDRLRSAGAVAGTRRPNVVMPTPWDGGGRWAKCLSRVYPRWTSHRALCVALLGAMALAYSE